MFQAFLIASVDDANLDPRVAGELSCLRVPNFLICFSRIMRFIICLVCTVPMDFKLMEKDVSY